MADLPGGPLTIFLRLYPKNNTKKQIIRSFAILLIGIDSDGHFYATRQDERQRMSRTATSLRRVDINRRQHVAV
ncbi:MAG: hypothetical protein LBK99_14475, partial [Opitutaceae bacterium]|nr:hypothetical protein [Opitutaceae bacterium]